MFKVGITGGIGSGKTTICKLFELQGIPVFYADSEAKEAMHTDKILQQQIKELFGDDVYTDGVLNRKLLASIVFNSEAELKKLNALVHPAVFKRFDFWAEKQVTPYVIKEAALLFETGSYKNCDLTLLVRSPEALKIARIMERDVVSEAEVLGRMRKQLSDSEKGKLSSFLIENDEQQLLIPQVLRLHTHILKIAAGDNDK